MIIRQNKSYETNSMYPDTNWYEDEDNLIIDETTEEGQQLAKLYIKNYPFVEFEHDGEFITSVTVLENEKQAEEERLEQERLEQELIDSLIPTEKEILMAELELSTLELLIELEVI